VTSACAGPAAAAVPFTRSLSLSLSVAPRVRSCLDNKAPALPTTAECLAVFDKCGVATASTAAAVSYGILPAFNASTSVVSKNVFCNMFASGGSITCGKSVVGPESLAPGKYVASQFAQELTDPFFVPYMGGQMVLDARSFYFCNNPSGYCAVNTAAAVYCAFAFYLSADGTYYYMNYAPVTTTAYQCMLVNADALTIKFAQYKDPALRQVCAGRARVCLLD
jgi:hypothetical protein